MSARSRSKQDGGHAYHSWTYTLVDATSLSPVEERGRLAGLKASGDGTLVWEAAAYPHQIRLRSTVPLRPGIALARRAQRTVRDAIRVLGNDVALLPGGGHPLLLRSDLQALARDGAFAGSTVQGVSSPEVPTLQGTCNVPGFQLRLPFANDQVFSKLHAALRLLLPILPALTAGSPYREGRWAGAMDSRCDELLRAWDAVPDVTGHWIPEAVFDQEGYDREVLAPMARALARLPEPAGPFDVEALNNRAAVPFFDEGLLEVRCCGTQEHPGMDVAITEFMLAVLRALMHGRWVSTYLQRAWSPNDLLAIHLQCVQEGGQAILANRDYLLMFGLLKQEQMSAARLWQHLFVELYGDLSDFCQQTVGAMLEQGCLAHRMVQVAGKDPTKEQMAALVRSMCAHLKEGRMLKAQGNA